MPTPKTDLIHDFLRHRQGDHFTPSEIGRALGLTPKQVANGLRQLANHQRLRGVEHDAHGAYTYREPSEPPKVLPYDVPAPVAPAPGPAKKRRCRHDGGLTVTYRAPVYVGIDDGVITEVTVEDTQTTGPHDVQCDTCGLELDRTSPVAVAAMAVTEDPPSGWPEWRVGS